MAPVAILRRVQEGQDAELCANANLSRTGSLPHTFLTLFHYRGGRGGGKTEGYLMHTNPFPTQVIVQELCDSRGGRPGLSVLTSLLVSVDVKLY